MVTRTAFLKTLDSAYTVYYDPLPIKENIADLVAGYAFHSANESYVLSKKATLWRAETNEYAYIFSLEELNEENFLSFKSIALELGKKRIHPHIDHMTSNITAVFICDRFTDAAGQLLRQTKIHKNFLFSLFGWMDFRCATIALESGRALANRAGKDLEKFLLDNYGKCLSQEDKA